MGALLAPIHFSLFTRIILMATAPQSTTGLTPTGQAGRSPYSDKGDLTIPAVSGLAARSFGDGVIRETLFLFNSMPLTLLDTQQYTGLKIGTFPKAIIDIMGGVASLNFTTFSALNGGLTQLATGADAITGGLNDSKTVNWGFGTATAAATPITNTGVDIIPGYGQTAATFTSSTLASYGSANPAGPFKAFQQLPTTYANALLGAPKRYDGTTTAIAVFLNADVPTAGDIDSDTVVKVDGWMLMQWRMLGNYVLS